MKPRIYIAGQISNDPDFKTNFMLCEDFLNREGIYYPLNPAAIVKEFCDKNYPESERNESTYFKLALNLMLDRYCKDIIMLPGFFSNQSRCQIELNLAIALGYNIHEFREGKRIKL
jgi:hypothetical protein